MNIILGAGLSGLTLAFELKKKKKNFKIFEKDLRPGGLLKTEKKEGYLFDYTGHLLHFSRKEVEDFVKKELKLFLYKHRRNSFVFIRKKLVPYPFQYNLFYLPEKLKRFAVVEFIKARTLNKNSENFYNWCINNFGKGISELFLIPYNQKLWNYDLKKLTLNWMQRFFPPATEDVIEGAILPFKKKYGYNAYFYYPKFGIEELIKKLSKNIAVECRKEAKKINLRKRTVKFTDGSKIKFKNLISTIPLKELIFTLEDAPLKIKNMAKKLKSTNVFCLNLGVKKEIKDIHWIYFPEKEFPFYRIGIQSNFSNFIAPPKKSSIYIEVSFRKNKVDKEAIIKKLKVLNIEKKDIEVELPLTIKNAYVIYDKEREKIVPEIFKFLKKNRIFTIGRFGRWEYSSMEESILEAKEIVERIN